MIVSATAPLPPSGRATGKEVPPQSPTVMLMATQLLERISRSKVGQDILMAETSVQIAVKVCTVFFNAPKKSTLKGAKMEDSNTNMHLEFGFRLLDRLSRTERGLAALRRYAGRGRCRGTAPIAIVPSTGQHLMWLLRC